jgi:hypothetical protein
MAPVVPPPPVFAEISVVAAAAAVAAAVAADLYRILRSLFVNFRISKIIPIS